MTKALQIEHVLLFGIFPSLLEFGANWSTRVYQLALIIGPHLLIEQENHLPSVNL